MNQPLIKLPQSISPSHRCQKHMLWNMTVPNISSKFQDNCLMSMTNWPSKNDISTSHCHCYTINSAFPINTLRPRQNGRLFTDDTFKRIFLNENIRISTKNSLKFVSKDLINNIPALVLIMAWRRPGDKPLSEPMMVNLPTHICVTRPQWVNHNISRPWSDSIGWYLVLPLGFCK